MRVGIFDSGVGGLSSLAYFRKLAPEVDTVFFADSENAPYGTKTQSELIELVSADIERLTALGCDKVLMACCSASTVHHLLPKRQRDVSIPIILPTARRACELSVGGGIGVLSTEATRKSGAFVKAIGGLRSEAHIVSASSGELVTLAEAGACDENLGAGGKRVLERALLPFFCERIDTLILGCTHFGRFRKTIEAMLGVRAVNSATEGALALFEYCRENIKI